MGWKASCVFATSEEGYLNSFPPHQPEKAKKLLRVMGGKYKNGGPTTFEDGIFPDNGEQLYIGAYEKAIVVGSTETVDNAFHGGVPWIVDHARSLVPGARVLIITLHSVVNLFGYAWFEDGQFVRGRAGSADDGVFFEQGDPLDLEKPMLAKSVIRNGRRVYVDDIHGEQCEFDESAFGEEFVMELCRPFLGCRLDQFDLWDLKMERFTKSWW